MSFTIAALMLFSISLSTAAQILLKLGMGSLRAGSGASPTGGAVGALMQAALSPWVVGGLIAYGASAVVWLLVLRSVDVSKAYPCVALGFALTVLAGHFLLGEPVGPTRILGVAIIMGGVLLVANS